MQKDHCLINIRNLLPQLEKNIVREAQSIIEYHKNGVAFLPENGQTVDAVLYLTLKRIAEQYKPKPVNGSLL